jgi:hypothetical protein
MPRIEDTTINVELEDYYRRLWPPLKTRGKVIRTLDDDYTLLLNQESRNLYHSWCR